MRSPFFFGEYELTIDSKNRLLVPADVRKRINPETDGDAFFVTLRNKIPLFYPERYYENLVHRQIRPGITPSPEVLRWAQLKISLASRVEWDAQGRVVLPEKLLQRAGLTSAVCLVGMNDHLALWDQQQWSKHRDRLLEEADDIEEKLRQLIEKNPGAPELAAGDEVL